MPGQRTGHLLRIPRTDTDRPNDFVLLRVNPSSSSSAPLDAYILATEGEAAYGLKIKNSSIQRFLHKAFTGTHEEFRAILSSLLLGVPVKGEDKQLLEGIGISATIEGGTITLAVRKSVGGIKQRIAAIDIPQTEDEIELYNWVGDVCIARDESETKLEAQEKRVNDLEKNVERLIAQLKDLTSLKKEHEDAMLVKFQELLNSKKQHIRELTRLVNAKSRQNNSIGISPEAAPSKSTEKGKNTRKRAAAPIEEEDESDGGFAMAIDKTDDDEEDEVDSDQRSDPRTTADEAEVETYGYEEPQQAVTKIKKTPTASAKGKGKATTTAAGHRKKASKPAPAKLPARNSRAGSKKPTTAKTTTATRRPRGKQAAKAPEPEELSDERAPPPEPSPPPAPDDDSNGMDDDEL